MTEKKLRRPGNISTILTALIVILLAILLFRQKQSDRDQAAFQEKLIQLKSDSIEATRKKGLAFLMSNILDQVDHEINRDPDRKLSNETISRIAVLSDSFEPQGYNYIETDSLGETNLSRERADLLLILVKLNLDSSTFERIKAQTSFAGADFGDAQLPGVNFNGINLMSANLKGANLSESTLINADLRGVNLWGANLNKSNLKGALMNRADLRWAEMNEAILTGTMMKGADLSSAKMRKADMRNADVQFANLSDAFLNEADLENGTIYWSDLSRANLTGVNLTKVDMRRDMLRETILMGATMKEVRLEMAVFNDENWLSKLEEWKVQGAKEIQQVYKIKSENKGNTRFTLEKAEEQ